MNFEELIAHFRETRELVNAATVQYSSTLYEYAYGADVVMEIGIGPEAISGTSFAATMANGGTLYSLDINPDRPTNEQFDFVTDLGIDWIIAHGDSLKTRFRPSKTLDLLYIDGDHGHVHVKGDFETFSPYVKSGGYIIFDDISPLERPLDLAGSWVCYDNVANGHFIHRKV